MAFYTFLGFVRPAILILLIPIYLSVFSDKEWAIYSLILVVGSFSMILCTLRINAAMLTHYYDYFRDRTQLARFLSTSFTSSLVIGSLFVLLAYIFGESVFDSIFKSDEIHFFPYGFTIIIYAVLSEVNLTYITFLRNEKNLRRFALVVLTQILLVIVFQYLLIVSYRQGVQGALIGLLASNIITTLLIIILERKILTLRIDIDKLKKAVSFSVPLIPYLLIYWFMTKGERIVLEQFLDLALVGKYILLVTFTGVTILLIEATINGVRPFLFEYFSSNSDVHNKSIKLLTKLIVNIPLLALPVVILVGNNMEFLTTNSDFYEITPYVSLAAVIAYTLVYGKLFYQQLVFTKKSKLITQLSVISLIVFIAGLVYLIPMFAIWGVLYSVLLVNIVFAILFYLAGQKAFYVNYSFQSIIKNPLIVIICILVIEKIMISNGFSRSIYGMMQFLVITMLIIILNLDNLRDYKSIFIK